ncbi:hypothetical protein VNO77_27040 [Canavalia gladiata]|uniref:Uncharacterized protein n=1 Tax=Canavalia gladiata TaxID=3824 RepID=A0AAN9KWH8_CANGL
MRRPKISQLRVSTKDHSNLRSSVLITLYIITPCKFPKILLVPYFSPHHFILGSVQVESIPQSLLSSTQTVLAACLFDMFGAIAGGCIFFRPMCQLKKLVLRVNSWECEGAEEQSYKEVVTVSNLYPTAWKSTRGHRPATYSGLSTSTLSWELVAFLNEAQEMLKTPLRQFDSTIIAMSDGKHCSFEKHLSRSTPEVKPVIVHLNKTLSIGILVPKGARGL